MGTTSVFEPIECSRTLLTSRKRNGSELVRLLAGQSRWFVIALALVLIGGLWLFLRRGSTPHKIAGVDHPVPQAQVRERTKSAADEATKASRDLTEQITHEAIQSRRENPTGALKPVADRNRASSPRSSRMKDCRTSSRTRWL